MSKKSGTSSHGLKKAEVETKEATPEAKPPTLPSRSTNSVSSFTPEIIKPKPAVKTRASEEFDDEVKVSKSNIKKYGVPLPGLHVEEPEEVKSEKKEESDDGWSDEDEEASEAKPEISLAKNDEKKNHQPHHLYHQEAKVLSLSQRKKKLELFHLHLQQELFLLQQ